MSEKTIILYENYPGVRFVLERSLSIYEGEITVHASSVKELLKKKIKMNGFDLLITEISQTDLDGIEISSFARKLDPEIKIIWVTASSCSVFRQQKKRLGNITCIEKPLEIRNFRENVLEVLEK